MEKEIEKLKKKNKEANDFIKSIAEMLNIETDGLGYNGLTLDLSDFQDAINTTKWIAVADSLPEREEEVLTITSDMWYRVMTFGSTGRRFPSQVTHWKRLPKPPL